MPGLARYAPVCATTGGRRWPDSAVPAAYAGCALPVRARPAARVRRVGLAMPPPPTPRTPCGPRWVVPAPAVRSPTGTTARSRWILPVSTRSAARARWIEVAVVARSTAWPRRVLAPGLVHRADLLAVFFESLLEALALTRLPFVALLGRHAAQLVARHAGSAAHARWVLPVRARPADRSGRVVVAIGCNGRGYAGTAEQHNGQAESGDCFHCHPRR